MKKEMDLHSMRFMYTKVMKLEFCPQCKQPKGNLKKCLKTAGAVVFCR